MKVKIISISTPPCSCAHVKFHGDRITSFSGMVEQLYIDQKVAIRMKKKKKERRRNKEKTL